MKMLRLRKPPGQVAIGLAAVVCASSAGAQSADQARPVAVVKEAEKTLESRRTELKSTEIRSLELEKAVEGMAVEREQINRG
jgi:hypothetical protein